MKRTTRWEACFFTGTKWPECEVHCLLPVTSQVKKRWHCTADSFTKFLHGVAMHKFNFYIQNYIHCIYRSTWYVCKLRLDYKLPAAHAFHRIAYRLSPTSLFRKLKFLTEHSTHLLKLN